MAHGGLPHRSFSVDIRRRDGHPHLLGSPLRLRPHRRESVPGDPEKPRQEHHAAYEPSSRRDGTFHGRGRCDHLPSRRYVRGALIGPRLAPGQVVVMDNLGAHRPRRIRELIGEFLYLPPYSPDLNPIGEALSKIKQLLQGRSQPAPRRHLSRPWVTHWEQWIPKTCEGSSFTVATTLRRSYCERCC